MMSVKKFTCIICPRGCPLVVDGSTETVSGNACPRGVTYGLAEATNPTRILTSTMKIAGLQLGVLPVRTREPIPKRLLFDAMREINAHQAKLPVAMGETLIESIADSGIALIASRSIT